MATSVVILLSLLNTNTMSNMFDLNYFKTQEKNKLLQIRKQNYETKRSLSKALMYNNNKTYKTYNFNNYNIMKERKR
jgi:Tfp pilus assembly protein PilV